MNRLRPWAASAALFLSAAATAWPAGLAWERTSIEVEAKPGQGIVNFDFPFRNTGAAAVTLVSVEPSCRCLSVEVPRMTAKPGEDGHVLVAFSVGSTEGTQEKSVFVTTDEHGGAPVTLVLRVRPARPAKP